MASQNTGLESSGPVEEHFCQSFIITSCHDDRLTGPWNILCPYKNVTEACILTIIKKRDLKSSGKGLRGIDMGK